MKHAYSLFGSAILALALAACNQAAGPTVDPARVLSGTAQGWPGGTATIQPVATDESGTTIVSELDVTSTIADDGSFELTLPETLGSEQLATVSICSGTFDGTVTPEEWGEFVAELAVMEDGLLAGGLLLASDSDVFFTPQVGDEVVLRLYVDRDVSVKGTCTETDGTVIEYDADAEEGWNFLVFEVLEVSGEGFPARARVTTPESVPAGVEWHYLDFQQALGAGMIR